MTLVQKTLFNIELMLGARLSLAGLAARAGCTPYHLSRVFTATTDQSLMRYVRDRQLSEAAKALAGGAPDVLDVALEAHFESHEAFTRAFKARFGQTPKQVRDAGSVHNLDLTEALIVTTNAHNKPKLLGFDVQPARTLVGLSGKYNAENVKTIPALWQKLGPWFGNVPGAVDGASYGVSYDVGEDGFRYFCGFEVRDPGAAPSELVRLDVPEQFCARFEIKGHISKFQDSYRAIWREYFDTAETQPVLGFELEIYDSRFLPDSDDCIVEAAIPVDQKTAEELAGQGSAQQEFGGGSAD